MTKDNDTPEETKEIDTQEELRRTEFLKYYLDTSNKETYANATQSAIAAFGFDRKTQYNYARNMGSKMVARCDGLVREHLENKGLGLPKMIDVAVSKMIKSVDGKPWWDELMIMAQYKQATPQNINNTQINVVNTDPKSTKSFNDKFQDWLENGG